MWPDGRGNEPVIGQRRSVTPVAWMPCGTAGAKEAAGQPAISFARAGQNMIAKLFSHDRA
jgi:hypothetical protein